MVEKDRTVKEEKDGKEVEVDKHDRQGLWDVFVAPIKGMSEKLDVIVFVMVLGGFLGVTMKTGALDASLGALLHLIFFSSFTGREKVREKVRLVDTPSAMRLLSILPTI